MQKKLLIGLAAFLAIALLGYFLLPKQADDAHPQLVNEQTTQGVRWLRELPVKFKFVDGQERHYGFSYAMQGTLDVALLGEQGSEVPQLKNIELEAEGSLHLKFVLSADNAAAGTSPSAVLSQAGSSPSAKQVWQVLGVVRLARLVGRDELAEAIDTDLSFMFSFAENGLISDLTGESDVAQELIAMLLPNLQVMLPNTPKAEWKTKEADDIGRYYADYNMQNGFLYKTKTQYFEHAGESDGLTWATMEMSSKLNQSQITVKLAQDAAWFERLELSQELDGFMDAQMASSTRLNLITFAIPASYDVRFLGPEEFLAQNKQVAKFTGMAKYYESEPALNAMAAGLSNEEVLSKYLSLLEQQEETLSMRFIINYLRLKPDATIELVKMLDQKGDISHEASLRLWYAISAAGHAEAQQALVDVANGTEFTASTKNRALSVVHDIEYPTDALVDGILNASVNLSAERREQSLKNMAVLALGSLGAPHKLNPEQTDKVATLLEDSLAQASDERQKTLVLDAIGNSGNPDLVDLVSKEIVQASPNVRTTGLITLMKMPGTQAKQRFYDLMQDEQDDSVKYFALERLALRSTPDMQAWAIEQVQEEKNAENKTQYIHYLGRLSDESPEAENSLRDLLNSDSLSLEQKSAIYEYIKP